jgi:hypothetical protein
MDNWTPTKALAAGPDLMRLGQLLSHPGPLRRYLETHLETRYWAESAMCCPFAEFVRDAGYAYPRISTNAVSWRHDETTIGNLALPEWAMRFVGYVDGRPGQLTGAEALAALDAVIGGLSGT